MEGPDRIYIPWLESATVANVLKGHPEMVSVEDLRKTLRSLSGSPRLGALRSQRKAELIESLLDRVEDLGIAPPVLVDQGRRSTSQREGEFSLRASVSSPARAHLETQKEASGLSDPDQDFELLIMTISLVSLLVTAAMGLSS